MATLPCLFTCRSCSERKKKGSITSKGKKKKKKTDGTNLNDKQSLVFVFALDEAVYFEYKVMNTLIVVSKANWCVSIKL